MVYFPFSMNKLGKAALLLGGFLSMASCDKSERNLKKLEPLQVRNSVLEKLSTHTADQCFQILHPCVTRQDCDFSLSYDERETAFDSLNVKVKVRVDPKIDVRTQQGKQTPVVMQNSGYDVDVRWSDASQQIVMDVNPVNSAVNTSRANIKPQQFLDSAKVFENKQIRPTKETEERIERLKSIHGLYTLERFEEWLKALNIQVQWSEDASIRMVSLQTHEKCIQMLILLEGLSEAIAVDVPLAEGTCEAEMAERGNADSPMRQRCKRIGLLRSSLSQLFGAPVVLSNNNNCQNSSDVFARFQEWTKSVNGVSVEWNDCKLFLGQKEDPRLCAQYSLMNEGLAMAIGHVHLRNFEGSCQRD